MAARPRRKPPGRVRVAVFGAVHRVLVPATTWSVCWRIELPLWKARGDRPLSPGLVRESLIAAAADEEGGQDRPACWALRKQRRFYRVAQHRDQAQMDFSLDELLH